MAFSFSWYVIPFVALIAFLLYTVAPKGARKLLFVKQKQLNSYFSEQLSSYRAHLARDKYFVATLQDKKTRALAIWRRDMIEQTRALNISRERYDTLVTSGVIPTNTCDAPDKLPRQASLDKRYVYTVSSSAQLFLVSASSLSLGVYGAFGIHEVYAVYKFIVFAVACVLLSVCALVDLCANIAPFEIAAATFVCGILMRLLGGGGTELFEGMICAIVVALVLLATNAFCNFRHKPKAIGLGDIRLLPACALLVGAHGIVVFLCALALIPLGEIAYLKYVRKFPITAKTKLPFAPVCALATYAGVIATVLI